MTDNQVNNGLHDVEPAPTAARTRDAAATRRALIAAATELFSREGYDQVGVRAIAARAGVNQALLNRYFGSKAGLFAAVVSELFSDVSWFGGGRASFGLQVSSYLFAKPQGAVDPLALILRSSTHPEAATIVRDTLDKAIVQPLATWLGAEEATARAGAIVSVLTGVSVMRVMLGSRSMTGEAASAQADLVGRLLQAIVDGKV